MGIGVTAPDARLNVVGTTHLEGTTTVDGASNLNGTTTVTGATNLNGATHVTGTTELKGATHLNGTARVGANGTVLTDIIKVTVVEDVPSIAPNTAVTVTFTVTNAQTNSAVYVSPDVDLPNGLVIGFARVSAANTVTMKLVNNTAVNLNPANMQYHIAVIR